MEYTPNDMTPSWQQDHQSDNETQAVTASPFFRGAKALADYLQCDPVTIRRLIRKHVLPYIKLGGCYLFRRGEIDEMLERHHVGAVWMKRTRRG